MLGARELAAQTNTGEISGAVRDAQGGVLPGATVVAEQPASGFRVERISDGTGRYRLTDLRIGEYTVTFALTGFRTIVRTNVVVKLGQTQSLDVALEVGGVSEEIHVVAATDLLQATNAEISDIIDQRTVVDIPLNGRNFLSLAQLSDAVVIPPGGTRGDALQQAGPLPNVGGQRSGHNIYLLDGVKVTDELFNNLVISPSVDSIQEFKIQKSQYAAEFGGKASALINVATRAGANVFHGSGFEFFRDAAFDAHNYFDDHSRPVPPLQQNQFGGTAGGPIVRDRTFYFASYEGQRSRRSLTRTFSVPSAAIRSGDFSGLDTICDPSTVAASGACTPFANNRIPAGRIDPIASAFLQRVPLPTSTAASQNLLAVEPQIKDVDQVSVRIDHRFSSDDQLFVRVSTFEADEAQPFGTSALQEALVPGFGRDVTTRTRNVGVSHTHTFGPAWLNELRGGWMEVKGGQTSVNRGVDFAAATGLQGVTSDPRDVGYPLVTTRGTYSPMGDPASFVYRNNSHVELYDSVLVSRGAHRVKFGGYLFHLRLRPEQPDNARGTFSYTGQFTGNAFADFLLGYPAAAVSGIGRGDEDGRTTWTHAFVQDDWRVRDNLTLNLGLRYEHNAHMTDAHDRLSSVELGARRYVIASDDAGNISSDAGALIGLLPLPSVTSAEAGWDRGLLRRSPVRLAPRTGFALSLADNRAVVRGGYGIFLNQWAYSVQTALARNLPFFYTRQVDVPADARVPLYDTRTILTADPTGVVSPSIMDHDYRVEYTQTWSGGLQYEIAESTMVEASYMGSWTLGADNGMLRNVPVPGPGAIQSRREIPEIGVVRSIRFDGRSIYHALTLKAQRRLRGGYSFDIGYTLSQSKDDASSPGATESENGVPQDVRNIFSPTGEWARSSFDHRHLLVASGTYELRGWRLNAVLSAQSGAPFTVNLGVDRANVGAGPAQRPDQLRDPNLPSGSRTPVAWFDTSAFALPAAFTFGDAPRNSVIGPGFVTLDTAVARSFAFGAGPRLELRWEVFNALNRANFELPDRLFGSATFGRISSAKAAREMQFGVKLQF